MVVTRARAQASGLAAELRDLGAEVIELPAIRIEPRLDSDEVRRAVDSLHTYALVCLTSPNGVDLLFEAMAAAGRDARALANATVAAIGPGTAGALARHGIAADVVPERFVAEALAEALRAGRGRWAAGADRPRRRGAPGASRGAPGTGRRGRRGRALRDGSRARHPADELEAARSADYLTFTSSSTVRNFAEALDRRLPERARVVSIGPVTSEAARQAGLEVAVEAERHDIEGLIEALLADAASRGEESG